MSNIHSPQYQYFLQRLKQARIDAGFTQVHVASSLNLTQSVVSKCESGERRVDVTELQRFAQLYQKDISFFLFPDDRAI